MIKCSRTNNAFHKKLYRNVIDRTSRFQAVLNVASLNYLISRPLLMVKYRMSPNFEKFDTCLFCILNDTNVN